MKGIKVILIRIEVEMYQSVYPFLTSVVSCPDIDAAINKQRTKFFFEKEWSRDHMSWKKLWKKKMITETKRIEKLWIIIIHDDQLEDCNK